MRQGRVVGTVKNASDVPVGIPRYNFSNDFKVVGWTALSSGAPGRQQQQRPVRLGRGHRSHGRVQIVELGDRRFQPVPSAFTPGRSLPSSHSRNAPPAVET